MSASSGQRHTRAGYQSRQFGPCHGAVGDTGDADQSPFEDDDVVRACLADRCQSPLGLVEQPLRSGEHRRSPDLE